MPRALLGYDGTDFYVVRTDATGNLQIDVLASALPAGAATAAHQLTMITALQLIDDLRGALDSVGTDELDVNVEASVLPTGAATAGNQATMITALQLIDNLQAALQSAATDRLIVRGEDQLFSIEEVLAVNVDAVISGANGYITTGVVPAGRYWCVQNIEVRNATTGATDVRLQLRHDGVLTGFGGETRAIAAGERWYWQGEVWADVDDTLRAYWNGGLAGDSMQLRLTGYQMTIEA